MIAIDRFMMEARLFYLRSLNIEIRNENCMYNLELSFIISDRRCGQKRISRNSLNRNLLRQSSVVEPIRERQFSKFDG